MTEIKEDNVCQAAGWVPENRFRRSWAKLRRNKAALVGGILLLAYILSALFAPVLFRGNPSAPNLIKSLETPTLREPLGTDELGRSILSHFLYSSRISLLIAVGVVSVGIVNRIPILHPGGNIYVYHADRPVEDQETSMGRSADFRCVLPGYFKTMGMPLLAGRDIFSEGTFIGLFLEKLAEG